MLMSIGLRQGRIGFYDAFLAHLYPLGKIGLGEGW
jgi:hypothetical protein